MVIMTMKYVIVIMIIVMSCLFTRRHHGRGQEDPVAGGPESSQGTANLRTHILDFRGFDSSTILILRGGIPVSIGDFPESLSQTILVGIILVGRLGVRPALEDLVVSSAATTNKHEQ